MAPVWNTVIMKEAKQTCSLEEIATYLAGARNEKSEKKFCFSRWDFGLDIGFQPWYGYFP
jgi:hypothetical protein